MTAISIGSNEGESGSGSKRRCEASVGKEETTESSLNVCRMTLIPCLHRQTEQRQLRINCRKVHIDIAPGTDFSNNSHSNHL